MCRFSRRILGPLFGLALVGIAGAVPADAQGVDRNRVFEVTVDAAGQIFTASIREGEPLRLTLYENEQYEVSTVLVGGSGEEVLVAISRGSSLNGGRTEIVERLSLRPGVMASMRAHPKVRMVLDRIWYAAAPAARTQPRPISFALPVRASGSDSCCVCCGEACACACGVSMSCGSCCMEDCCGMVEPTDGPAGENSQRIRNARLARFLGSNTCEKVFPEAVARIASSL